MFDVRIRSNIEHPTSNIEHRSVSEPSLCRNLAQKFAAIVILLSTGLAAADIDERQFRADVTALASHPSRVIGSDGYQHSLEYVRAQIESLPGVELRTQTFPVMMPLTRRARLTLPGGGEHRIYPFWPAGVRTNSTPADGIRGKLIYVEQARPQQITPGELAGQIAVVEWDGDWTQAAAMGARAVLVLGRADVNNILLRRHELSIPINLPRFYVPGGELADRLRRNDIHGEARLDAQVDWHPVEATNLLALVRPRSSMDSKTGALLISVPLESSSLVPELSPGASQAVQPAAALAMLRGLARDPPQRPVVFFFSGADSIQMLGTREMLMSLADVPRRWRRELASIAETVAHAQGDLRRLHEGGAIDRVIQIIKTDAAIEQDLLFRLRGAQTIDSHDRERIESAERRQAMLNRLRSVLTQRPQELTGELTEPARQYTDRAIERIGNLLQHYSQRRNHIERRVELYQWLARRLGRDEDPSERTNNSRLIELLVGLDLSDAGTRVGPMYFGRFLSTTSLSHIQDYRDWFGRMESAWRAGRPEGQWLGPLEGVLDLEPFAGTRSPASWLAAAIPVPSELAAAWGVPGFSFVTLDDLRLRRDTPADTLANLRVDPIVPQLRAAALALRIACNDPLFKGPVELKWQRADVRGQVVSMAPGSPVPDLPREGFLATYLYVDHATLPQRIPRVRGMTAVGVRRSEIRSCDAEGRYLFEGLPTIGPGSALWVQVFRLAQDGAVTACTDVGRQSDEMRPAVRVREDSDPLRSLVFNCEEFSLLGLYDPRYFQPLRELTLLDARRGAEPQRFNLMPHEQMLAGFVEPGTRAQLAFRYGRVGNRLLLINMPATPEATTLAEPGRAGNEPSMLAQGFTAEQLNTLGPLALATSRDFWRLDEIRLDAYRRAGVSNDLLDSLHGSAAAQIEQADTAMRRRADGATLLRHAGGAWATEARVYLATQAMANDVVRGAIFLLLLCVPFALCMERLLIGTPNVYRQIAGMGAIFAVMAGIVWGFHPAFRISTSPLIVVLAFAIILMSGVVIAVVYGKFDTELKRIRSGRGSSEGASFRRAGALGSAVLLGIANMRRRKFRTALTAVTIALITFAVLCFAGATRYLQTVTVPTGRAAHQPGVVLRQRGFRPIPETSIEHLRAALNGRTLVQRWWNANAADYREHFHVVAPNSRIFPAQAVLGLSPGESRASPVAQLIGTPKFARLEHGETRIIFLSQPIAKTLGVKEGDTVRMGGIELQVAAVFDAESFDRGAIDLAGEPLAPLRYSQGALDVGGRRLGEEDRLESLDLDVHASQREASGSYEHLSSSQFVIVPGEVSRLLPSASLRSVAIPLDDWGDVTHVSDELSRRFSAALVAAFEDGVKMVTAGQLTRVSGTGQLAVPLTIAALIIFNTMLGSIAERRREIHIYTSLGLAPLHVGALFLAEALTYGLIGTVFGYVAGQGAATALAKLGWLGNVTLNYSGSSAIWTMSLILGVVLISALIPARMASKLAAPSIERSWKVPQPIDGRIVAPLPFTINKTAADGALAYLREFFDAHREGSIGRFSADAVEPFTDGIERGLRAVVWLTPFDLGVRQNLTLRIHPGQFPDIYEVQVTLDRLSGDDRSWHRMNRPFLTELRQQFLQWRSLSPQKMAEYVGQSQGLFASDRGLP